eukprot:TRINITY_DN6828_c0_g1_i1.p1 TRINITY_DN6828_c0_g1~~TRINITY_DN6828_c0_g1_i1.p1  ORF type:complete len:334 (-),score=57.87 TRINITY_DN6828_c0_g1_i1:36-1016(-)
MADKGPVCVTGASGFIASHLVKQLLEKGYTVHGTVRDSSNEKKTAHLRALPNASTRLKLFDAELLDGKSFDKAIQGCAGVFHTASPLSADGGDAGPQGENYIKPAVEGALNVLNAAMREPKVHRVVLTSSTAAVFGKQEPNDHLWTEDDWSNSDAQLQRKNWYAASKTLAERAAWHFMQEHTHCHFTLATILPTMVLGPMLQPQVNESTGMVVKILKGERKEIPDMSMSFVDVRDVAAAHIAAYEESTAAGRFLCMAQSVHMEDFYEMCRAIMPGAPVATAIAGGKRTAQPSRFTTQKAQAIGVTFRGVQEALQASVDSLKSIGAL